MLPGTLLGFSLKPACSSSMYQGRLLRCRSLLHEAKGPRAGQVACLALQACHCSSCNENAFWLGQPARLVLSLLYPARLSSAQLITADPGTANFCAVRRPSNVKGNTAVRVQWAGWESASAEPWQHRASFHQTFTSSWPGLFEASGPSSSHLVTVRKVSCPESACKG